VAWGDYDGDGDLDILLAGDDTGSNQLTKIYRNDGGTFVDINAGLEGIRLGSVSWGDYDGDGDLDILLSGENGIAGPGSMDEILISKVYRNDGGTFVDINAGLEEVEQSSAAWGDYDGDGDLDILLTGLNSSRQRISKIYRNNSVE
ncbi:MAG: FG-GAP-like repeat-containing protein, partial [Bacteroidota bacterium]